MPTPHIPKSSSWRGLFGRFGPALTLAALTALAAMFVVSSLNGCRRNADSNHSKDLVGKPLSEAPAPSTQKTSIQELENPNVNGDSKGSEVTNNSTESLPNPAEADAFAVEDIESLEPVTRTPFSTGAMSPVHPILDESEADDSQPVVSVRVNKLLAAKDVEKRRPIGEGNRFEANGESVWAWASVRNAGPERSHVWMIWKHEGMVRSRVRLGVGQSPRWRTWSRFRMRATHVGHWSVETTDADGMVLETMEFEVVPAEAATTAKSEQSHSK